MRRAALVFGGLALVLLAVNAFIVQKERVLAAGTVVLLELAPVDPRSLIQGDYMRLDYAIARAALADDGWPGSGRIVVRLDGRGVASFVRRHGSEPLAADEHLLLYRLRGSRIRLGSDAFFFQEGHAARYAGARYGELRVARDGGSVLVGLRDGELRPLR
jgi:uncharacterized membrane-anchored protein